MSVDRYYIRAVGMEQKVAGSNLRLKGLAISVCQVFYRTSHYTDHFTPPQETTRITLVACSNISPKIYYLFNQLCPFPEVSQKSESACPCCSYGPEIFM